MHPGCGTMHQNTVSLPGATPLKKMDAAFLGSYQMPKASLLGVGVCPYYLFPLWDLVGLILHKSCVCCDNYELQTPLPGGAQKALFPRSPPLPLTLFLSTLLCIPGARQEDVWCGSPIQGWTFCGLSFSAPLLVVVVCVHFHLLQIDFLMRVERSIDLWE